MITGFWIEKEHKSINKIPQRFGMVSGHNMKYCGESVLIIKFINDEL